MIVIFAHVHETYCSSFFLSCFQVLPFDDNLCLIEPCPSFSVCLSMVRQGQPKQFISSSSVLFRPIHPDHGYKCECPRGFAGISCVHDT